MKKVLHTIVMVDKSRENKALYNNVVDYMGLYGCLIELHLADGTTATFDKAEWDMFDLTPTKGWNSNATDEFTITAQQ